MKKKLCEQRNLPFSDRLTSKLHGDIVRTMNIVFSLEQIKAEVVNKAAPLRPSHVTNGKHSNTFVPNFVIFEHFCRELNKFET